MSAARQAVGIEPIMAGGGEQQQALAGDVELELAVDLVADDVEATRLAGQVEGTLVRHGGAGGSRTPVRNAASPTSGIPCAREAHV
ncbi:hypothetical protein [Kitasatospora sp. NPDC058190]|uniref:hypothetical protein n=1 Tax=Kitasatospora sp. NPDC058190 TaxID=3346371 RepID=UPI0036DA552E